MHTAMKTMKRVNALCIIVLIICVILVLKQGTNPHKTHDEEMNVGWVDDSDNEEFSYEKALAAKNQSYDSSKADIVVESHQKAAAKKKDYTVMVYMVGSNLESNLGNGTADIREMEAAGLDYDKANLILYTGGSRRWTGNIPADQNCVIDLSQKEDRRIVAHTEGNADMGAPETLAAFLNFAAREYPSDHYALICWDHGGGPLWGFGSDELYNNDSILLSEVRKAMNDTPFKEDNKLDWVGFDACLMGSYESMHAWSDYARYYVGSEEVEPGDGWDYSFLSLLNETVDPLIITEGIVDAYHAYYEKENTTSNPDLTISVADLSAVDVMDRAIRDLFKKIHSDQQSSHLHLRKKLNQGKSFGLVENQKGGEPFSYDLIDLGSMAGLLAEDYPKESQSLNEAINQLVKINISNVEETSGVTLYYPAKNKSQYRNMKSIYNEEMDYLREYRLYLEEMAKKWEEDKRRDWVLGDVEEKDGDYVLALTEDQKENISAAYFTIFSKWGEGDYKPVLQHCRAEIDSEGLVHIPADPQVICVNTSSGEEREEGEEGLKEKGNIWISKQVESNPYRNVYRSGYCHLDSSDRLFGNICVQPVTILLKEDRESGKVDVLSIEGTGSELEFAGKNQVDLSHWHQIMQGDGETIFPVWDNKGNLLPFDQWSRHLVVYSTNTLEGGLSFSGKALSEASREDDVFYFQRIEDRSFKGCINLSEVHFSESLQYIGFSAFSDDRKLADIDLPGSLEFLGYEAFCDDGSEYDSNNEYVKTNPSLRGDEEKTFHVGQNLLEIESDALACLNIVQFTVDDKNEWFSARDGMLYDKGGYVLKAIPPALKGEVHIPDGTKGLNLITSDDPCHMIKDLYIPDSVEYISNLPYSWKAESEDTACVIHCSAGSAAHHYAMDNGYSYVIEEGDNKKDAQ